MSNENKARKLIDDIRKKLSRWEGNGSFALKGVRNLSHADMETLIFYAEEIIRSGNAFAYMKLYGEKRDVMDAYGLLPAMSN